MKTISSLTESLIKIGKKNKDYYRSRGSKPVVALIGSPGSGKSTQARKIYEAISVRHDAKYINIGEILRKGKSKKIHDIMDKGDLVPDELVFEVLKKELSVRKKFIILDGFFRTDKESEWLLSHQKELDIDLWEILDIFVPESEAIKRLTQRGRLDDDVEDISNRMKIYNNEKAGVKRAVKKYGGRLSRVDGTGTVEEVFARIGKALDWCCPGYVCGDLSLIVKEKVKR